MGDDVQILVVLRDAVGPEIWPIVQLVIREFQFIYFFFFLDKFLFIQIIDKECEFLPVKIITIARKYYFWH